jgi:LuxR family maltose regulon positive regulatory protein
MYGFLSPPIVLAKVLVMADTQASRQRAQPYLDRLVDHLDSIHSRHALTEALAIRALLRAAVGEDAGAEDDLVRAIALAEPCRYIRLFVDLGPRVASLLNRLETDEERLQYIGQLLSALREEGADPAADHLPAPLGPAAVPGARETLSKREQQILWMLAWRYSNKEIAGRLNISAVTVKRHAANIYQKLGVHSRRQAVAKAIGLGIVARSDQALVPAP